MLLEPDHGRRSKYADFIGMYAALDENEWAIYRARSAKEDDMAVSFRQKIEEEGLQRGRSKACNKAGRRAHTTAPQVC